MSCIGVSLARYAVFIQDPKGKKPVPLTDVISISGLGLGDQGTVTLTQQDRIIELPDGIRKLPELGLSFRFKFLDVASMTIRDKLFNWYNNRSVQTYDITIIITNKTFCPQYSYQYIGCSILRIKENDKSMARPDFSFIDVAMTPYDVIYKNMSDTLKVQGLKQRGNQDTFSIGIQSGGVPHF